ncbi:MAG: hypothetical protein J5796_01895 [Erysipelotrichaceae bacterium]|nr:hypothetical protein [Erysipelotrichaceae bacterium]
MKTTILKKILLIMLIVLCGCTGGEEGTKKYDVGGKTYYVTKDNETKVWFGKDGNFVLIDCTQFGAVERTGTWSVEDNVLTLVKDDESGTVKFEIQDEDTIILKSSLDGCGFDDVFSTDEKYAGGWNNPNNGFEYTVFHNAEQAPGSRSSIEIRTDGSFTLIERNTGGVVSEISGLYGMTEDGGVYMFSNFDPFKDSKGNMVYNFEMMVFDSETLILNEDLITSNKNDQFTFSGELNTSYQSVPGSQFTTTTWVHEPFNDILEIYLPTMTIATDYSFTFMENTFSGMGFYNGYCQKTSNGWACDVLEADTMQGYLGEDVKLIEFEYDADGKTLILKTDLCSSTSGDRFQLQP